MQYLFRFDKPRKYQDKMIEDIYKAMCAKKNILINAPTGIGKTDASLAGVLTFAVENNVGVFFVTPKTSQHKIVVEALIGIKKKFNIDIKYIDMVGKRNLCVNTEVNGIESEAFYKACEDVVKGKKCQFYTNANNFLSNASPEVVEASSHGHNTFFNKCFDHGLCAYEVAAKIAKDSDVVIADYAHLLNPYTKETFLKKIAHSLNNTIVIWDEAHNILDCATSYLSTSLTTKTIENAELELQRLNSDIDLEYMKFILDEIAKKKLQDKSEAFLAKEDVPELLMMNIDEVAIQLEKVGLEYITSTHAKRSSLVHISKFLTSLKTSNESVARIVSKRPGNVKIALICLYPKESIKVFNEAYANVFMSGTLIPMKMYSDLFKLDNSSMVNYLSPFPQKNKLSFIDSEVSTKYESRSADEFRKIAEKIGKIKESVDGNLAVFFPSYGVLDSVFRYMGSYEIHIQRREMKSIASESLINEFKLSKDSILFGVMGGSLSEGIDYPNNLIKGIVVVGIPLAKPDLELNSRIQYIDKMFEGKGNEYAYLTPGVIRAAQSAGRAIRSEKDRAIIVFMDKRYNWKLYKSLINNFVNISNEKDYMGSIKDFFSEKSIADAEKIA